MEAVVSKGSWGVHQGIPGLLTHGCMFEQFVASRTIEERVVLDRVMEFRSIVYDTKAYDYIQFC